jgi:branched-chain amino acid transport system substrate-binding protein
MTDRTTDVRNIASAGFSRRTLMKTGIGAIAAPAVLRVIPANAQSKIIKIGYVNPRTGPLAGFGEADNFIIDQVKGAMGDGLKIGGKTYPVQIIAKDSQSTGTRAAGVASELILGDKVDILLASSAPDTTNPVADQAEVNEVFSLHHHRLPVAALFLRPERRSQ